jgi:hypothetical protein
MGQVTRTTTDVTLEGAEAESAELPRAVPYSSPKLVRLGSVRDLTLFGGTQGSDAGSAHLKTSG